MDVTKEIAEIKKNIDQLDQKVKELSERVSQYQCLDSEKIVSGIIQNIERS